MYISEGGWVPIISANIVLFIYPEHINTEIFGIILYNVLLNL